MCSTQMPRSTITMPDTASYDRTADRQIALMQQQQQSDMLLKQMELNRALASKQGVLSDLRDLKQQRAADTAANAQRMAALIGAPPPEPTAKAPVIGSDREDMVKAKGKKGLRIERVNQASQTTQGSGTGLNITSS
jgi:hypothetical protein